MYILVVEDDEATRDTLTFVLKSEFNLIVKSVPTVKETIEILHKIKPSCIFLDYLLDDGTAEAVISETRRIYKTNPPNIILMTAVQHPEAIAHRLGVDKLLIKPFSFEEIEQAVEIFCK